MAESTSRTSLIIWAMIATLMITFGFVGLALSMYEGKLAHTNDDGKTSSVIYRDESPVAFYFGITVCTMILLLFTWYAAYLWRLAWRFGREGDPGNKT